VLEKAITGLEGRGQGVGRVYLIFNGLTGANTNDALQKIQEEEAPKLAALQAETFLDDKLFKRVELIYQQRATLAPGLEGTRLVEWYYEHFVLAGARLSAADKATLKSLNEEDATLSTKFSNPLLA